MIVKVMSILTIRQAPSGFIAIFWTVLGVKLRFNLDFNI